MPVKRKTMTMGKSSSPDTMTARVPALLLFAASIRCTMSWSVPCVAMVMKVAPRKAAHTVYS